MGFSGSAKFGIWYDTYVFRLEGDVRYTMVAGLDVFLDDVLAREDFAAVTIDLRATTQIDSTALGLLARIGNFMLKRRGRRAVIVCDAGDVEATLLAMGFDEVFVITRDALEENACKLTEIPLADPGERGVARVVLDAHRELIAASEKNRQAFESVVNALERELGDTDHGEKRK